MNTLETLKERIYHVAESDPEEMQGCTEEEIAEVEAAAGFSLPKAYKDFLRFGGKRMGRFLWDHDYAVFYPRVIRLNERAKKEWDNRLDDPDNLFVFYCYDGGVFCFFRAAEGDDPPIYLLWGDDPVQKRYDSIWDLIEERVRDDERHF